MEYSFRKEIQPIVTEFRGIIVRPHSEFSLLDNCHSCIILNTDARKQTTKCLIKVTQNHKTLRVQPYINLFGLITSTKLENLIVCSS